MSTGAAVLEMLEIGGLFLGSTLLALVALLIVVRHFQDRTERAAVALVVETPDGSDGVDVSPPHGLDPGGASFGTALEGLQPPAIQAAGGAHPDAASPTAHEAAQPGPVPPAAQASESPAPAAPATVPASPEPPQATPPAPPAAPTSAPAAPPPGPDAPPTAPAAAPPTPAPEPPQASPAPVPPLPADASATRPPPEADPLPPPGPTPMPRPTGRARARAAAPPPAPAAAPSATAPPPAPTGRVVLGIDPEREDLPDTPQRHGVTPAEELTEDQLRRLNPRARRAALRKQSQKPLPDLDAIPVDLKEEVVRLLGDGKQIKAFGVFRKRLGVSFKDAEKGVVLVAHEAGLDLG